MPSASPIRSRPSARPQIIQTIASVNTALGGNNIINVNNVNSTDIVIGGAGDDRIILGSGGQNIVLGDNGEIDYTYNSTTQTNVLTSIELIDPLHGGDDVISGQWVTGLPTGVTFGNSSGAGTITLTGGASWASLGYAVGGGIYIQGTGTREFFALKTSQPSAVRVIVLPFEVSAIMNGMKSEVRDGMQIDWDTPIEMDDGIVLRADVFRPVGEGNYPVILSYGPYAKGLSFQEGYKGNWSRLTKSAPEVLAGSSNKYQNWELVDPEKWVPDGYACLRIDSRGSGRSPGMLDVWSPRETLDLYQCVEWAGTQPWSNDKVGINGISYYAMN